MDQRKLFALDISRHLKDIPEFAVSKVKKSEPLTNHTFMYFLPESGNNNVFHVWLAFVSYQPMQYVLHKSQKKVVLHCKTSLYGSTILLRKSGRVPLVSHIYVKFATLEKKNC